MDADRKFRLFPAIVGVFTSIEVDVFPATLQAPILKLDIDTSNAKMMVFQISKNTCESAKCSASECFNLFRIRPYVHQWREGQWATPQWLSDKGHDHANVYSSE